jgi:hypothetical protein
LLRLAGRSMQLSVEEIGNLKPDRRVYQLPVDRLGISAAFSRSCRLAARMRTLHRRSKAPAGVG